MGYRGRKTDMLYSNSKITREDGTLNSSYTVGL
jgi:hypothetical protein